MSGNFLNAVLNQLIKLCPADMLRVCQRKCIEKLFVLLLCVVERELKAKTFELIVRHRFTVLLSVPRL